MKTTLLTFCILGFIAQNLYSQNNAVRFDGINDYATVVETRGSTYSTGFTIEAWIKTTSSAYIANYQGNPAMTIIGDRSTSIANTFGVTSGRLQYNYYVTNGSTWVNLLGTKRVDDGIWHHVAMTQETTGLVKLYVDGIQDYSATINYFSINSVGFNTIGASYRNSTSVGEFFNGEMDNIRVWTRVLTCAELDEYKNTSTEDRNGSTHSFSFDGNFSMSNGPYLLSNGNGSLLNTSAAGASFVTGAPLNISGYNCYTPPVNRALNLDGINDYISLSRTTFINGLTIEALVKTTSTDNVKDFDGNAAQTIVGDKLGANCTFGLSGGKLIYKQVNSIGSAWDSLVGNSAINDGNWHHVAISFAVNGLAVLYVDGKSDGVKNIPYTISPTRVVINAIGAGYPAGANVAGDFFEGTLDEIRIWDEARSCTEINNNLNTSFSTTPGKLVFNYNMNTNTNISDFYNFGFTSSVVSNFVTNAPLNLSSVSCITPIVDNTINEIETKIYPNPAHDFIQVNNSNNENFILFDQIGKIALEGKLSNGLLNVTNIKPGIYLLKAGSLKDIVFIKE